MVVVTMAQLWWPLSPWLSPGAAWFVFFNAVVAAIAVMSSSCARQDQDRHASGVRLRRSASSAVLDHLRCFSLFAVHPVADGGVAVPAPNDLVVGVPDSDYYCHCSQEAEVLLPAPQVSNQVSAAVTETPRPTAPVAGESAIRMTERSAASIAPAATAATAAEPASVPQCKEQEEADAEEEEQGKSISMDEAYAMVQQSRPRQSPPAPAVASVPTTTTDATTAASWPQKTGGDRAAKKGPKRRRPGRRGAEEAPAELNARAELFIRQFREELKLQRINSLLRHTHALGPRRRHIDTGGSVVAGVDLLAGCAGVQSYSI